MFGREVVVTVTSLGVTNQRSSNKTQIGLKAVILVVCFLFMNRDEQKRYVWLTHSSKLPRKCFNYLKEHITLKIKSFYFAGGNLAV